MDEQLDEAARSFVNNPERNYLEGSTLHVSRIFKWFSEDFNDDVVGFFLSFAEADFKQRIVANRQSLEIEYLDYDWSLNGK